VLKLHINPVARALITIGAVAAIVTGVTFAALNSQTTLSGNTITATPGLLLSTNGSTYGSTIPGFTFNVTPGSTTGVSQTFNIKNTTASAMALSLSLPAAVTFTGGTVNNSDVHVAVACTTPTMTLTSDLATLATAPVPVTGSLTANTSASCTVSATMDSAAISSGSTVTSSSFNLQFSGAE
jgi:predicted ribosomally synthesized peptide with SipW-like signal peptide